MIKILGNWLWNFTDISWNKKIPLTWTFTRDVQHKTVSSNYGESSKIRWNFPTLHTCNHDGSVTHIRLCKSKQKIHDITMKLISGFLRQRTCFCDFFFFLLHLSLLLRGVAELTLTPSKLAESASRAFFFFGEWKMLTYRRCRARSDRSGGKFSSRTTRSTRAGWALREYVREHRKKTRRRGGMKHRAPKHAHTSVGVGLAESVFKLHACSPK